MKKLWKIMMSIFCWTLLMWCLYVNWTWGFQADWWNYVTDYKVIWTASWWNEWSTPRLIQTIKTTINRVLWILWLIALILCLWWWFQMLTAAGDESKVKSWTKVLKHAAIWLAVIWLSRLLVSFIFRLINQNAVATP